MSHKITWIDEPWLMFVEYYDRLAYRDVEEVMQVCIPQTEKHPIYFLIDLTKTGTFDPALLKSQSTMKLMRMPNTKLFAIVGVKGLFKFLVNYFSPFAQMKVFNDAEEARTFIEAEVAKAKQGAKVGQQDTVPPA